MTTALDPRASAVPRLWPGSTIVCLGGGPSLTRADVDAVRGRARVIAINNAYQLAPWADVVYACDSKWWHWHYPDVAPLSALKFRLQAPRPEHRPTPDVAQLRLTGLNGLETADPSGLRGGRNGGYQAINLAVHLGASVVLLLGYDMAPAAGRAHWHDPHPDGSEPPYIYCRRHFATLPEPLAAAGVTVINCSRRTALTTFPTWPLEHALARYGQAVECAA